MTITNPERSGLLKFKIKTKIIVPLKIADRTILFLAYHLLVDNF